MTASSNPEIDPHHQVIEWASRDPQIEGFFEWMVCPSGSSKVTQEWMDSEEATVLSLNQMLQANYGLDEQGATSAMILSQMRVTEEAIEQG